MRHVVMRSKEMGPGLEVPLGYPFTLFSCEVFNQMG